MADLYMSNERYLAALYRQRDRIIAGEPFVAWDDDTPGNKDTHASWGLCNNDAAAWPDAEDHLWPDQFENNGRVAPKYRGQHQPCPIQTKGGATGCFYRCRIFKSQMGPKSRQTAIDLYEAQIGKVRGALTKASNP